MSHTFRSLIPRLLLLCCALAPVPLAAQATDSAGIGRGWLLMEGGGRVKGSSIAGLFVTLAGGPDRTIVAITTAGSNDGWRPEALARCARKTADVFAVARATCLDARDRDQASSAAFLDVLRHADGVWFYGGDEGRLVDRYVGTGVPDALRAVLERGGVVGGTSAGSMILASYIPERAALPVSGFGFLPSSTISPHYTQWHFARDLRRDVARRPGIQGIGIDETTAIVVHAGRCDIIGEGAVTLVGPKSAVLHAGEPCDLGPAVPLR